MGNMEVGWFQEINLSIVGCDAHVVRSGYLRRVNRTILKYKFFTIAIPFWYSLYVLHSPIKRYTAELA